MDFEFSNEELSFRNELSAWLKDELANYHDTRSFTNDTDLKYLRRMQRT